MHSFSQASIVEGVNSPKASGEKVLIKALAVIVNPQSKSKTPEKKASLPCSKCI
jgi:hypothetical protein